MKSYPFIFFFLYAAIAVIASNSHDVGSGLARRTHTRRAHARSSGSRVSRRCQTRTSSGSSTSVVANNIKINSPSSSSSPAASSLPTISSAYAGLLSVASNCGSIGATYDITSQSGPNGNVYWLNCGIDNGGWNPPFVRVEDLVVKDLGEALQAPNSPFDACSAFISKFYQYGEKYGIPPILLASFAMQESSCNPATVGGAGEQGLMQLTHDKCKNAPGGNCQDIDYNIGTGAWYFSTFLTRYNGNVLPSIGSYNGWYKGMTSGEATAIAGACCRCQQNLDYLHQFLNGWCQNVNAYTANLGMYHNLAACPLG